MHEEAVSKEPNSRGITNSAQRFGFIFSTMRSAEFAILPQLLTFDTASFIRCK
jgi:hypothetical protein